MSDEVMCAYCGVECYDFEMKTDDKCLQCFVEECLHRETMRQYEASSHHRARFSEHCIRCDAFREIRFYFATKASDIQGTIEEIEKLIKSLNQEITKWKVNNL